MDNLNKFQKKWRKRNGKGCEYPTCACTGPLECEHGEKAAKRLKTLNAGQWNECHKCGEWYSANETHLNCRGYKVYGQPTYGKTAQLAFKEPACSHMGDKALFKINDSEIYATTIFRAMRDNAALAILCADTTRYHVAEADLPIGFEVLRKHTYHAPPTITLPWEDYSVPPVYMSFWSELIKLLPPGRVVVACEGSHGRTGTALAALLIVHLHMNATDAIDYVRKQHCKKAIESESQLKYLDKLDQWSNSLRV